MPIEHQIKSYFQTENILEGTLNYISELEASFDEHGIVTNFVQGQLWQEKKKLFQDKLTIPLFLYYDDYAVNDPLGSHWQRVYICILLQFSNNAFKKYFSNRFYISSNVCQSKAFKIV